MPEYQTKIVDKLGDTGEVVPLKYDITSYGADMLVDGVVNRLQIGDIIIPKFQRGFVWTYRQASRFIESLLLGLPVPGIFLSKDFDTQKMLVIDGQQRLKTLQFFYEGVFSPSGREFSLTGVQQRLDRLTYKALSDHDRRRLDNSILHATIVRQESPPEDDSSIYYLFERINTSGTPLSPQEIRSCIYQGAFNDLLKELNKLPAWRSLYGLVNKRMRDEELILRFFAFYFYEDLYKKPMREFLNRYMANNRKLELESNHQLVEVFKKTTQFINDNLGNEAFRPTRALNAAAFDSVMCGLARRLENGDIHDVHLFRDRYHSLLNNVDYQELILESTADEVNVKNRLRMATDTFRDIE